LNRKQKINLLNQLELGQVPVEMFNPVTIKLSYKSIDGYKVPISIVNDEDILELDSNKFNTPQFGINPYTGKFYGNIKILIVTSY
jgi:hypothetical protein